MYVAQIGRLKNTFMNRCLGRYFFLCPYRFLVRVLVKFLFDLYFICFFEVVSVEAAYHQHHIDLIKQVHHYYYEVSLIGSKRYLVVMKKNVMKNLCAILGSRKTMHFWKVQYLAPISFTSPQLVHQDCFFSKVVSIRLCSWRSRFYTNPFVILGSIPGAPC